MVRDDKFHRSMYVRFASRYTATRWRILFFADGEQAAAIKILQRAGILSVTNGRSDRGRFRRTAGRINIYKKKKEYTKLSGERAKRGP